MVVKELYKQTDIVIIPDNWEVKQIKEIALQVSSGRSSADSYFGTFPVYGSTGIIGYTDLGEYSGWAILIARVGANAGKISIVDGTYGVTDNTIILKINDSCVREYFWRRLDFRNLNSLIFGSGQPLITGTQIKNLQIPFPPKPEQQAIAEVLSDMDAYIDSLEQLIAKKRRIKQGVMQELLTGKRRLPGFTKEWKMVKLEEIINEISDGGTPSTSNPSYFGGSVNWVVIEDITEEINSTKTTLTEKGLNSCSAKLWPIGSIIFSTGATIGQVGIARIPVATKQGICGIIVDDEIANNKFIKYWLQNQTSQISSLAQGSTIKEVRVPTLIQFDILLPELNEQVEIASFLSDLDSEIISLSTKLSKVKNIEVGMMQELLTGRIRLI